MTTEQKKHYIHVAIFLILTFGIGFLPPFAQISEMGMKVLGAFVGVIYGWMFIGLAWPSIVCLLALGLSGYGGGISALFVTGWSYNIIPQLVFSYLFAEAIAQTQCTNYFAAKLLSMKFFIGKPFLLMFVFLFAFIPMKYLGIGLPGLFIMWKIFDEIADMAGYPERNEFCTIMVSSAVVMFVFVSLIFPWGPGPLMQIGLFNKGMPDVQVSYALYIIVWTVFSIIYVAVWTLLTKYILRPDFSAIAKIKDFDSADGKNAKLNFDQKFALVMLALFMILMFVPSFLPKTIPIVAFMNSFGLCGAIGLILCIMCAYMKKDGKPFLSLQVAAKGISWDVMWLLMATEPLANALNDAECGVISSLLATVTPIVMQLSPAIFLAACCIILGLITQVVHNLVLMVVFYPILCPMYAQMGGEPLAMFLALAIALNAAFATPAASWSSAMMFGVSSIQPKKMYFYGFAHYLLSVILGIIVVPILVGILV